MKRTLASLLLLAFTFPAVLAQERVYRCGNEYTNDAALAKARGCKPVDGSHVTVLKGSRAAPGSGFVQNPGLAQTPGPAAPAPAPNMGHTVQKTWAATRDPVSDPAQASGGRSLLESELHHTRPDKQHEDASEGNVPDWRNPQRYLERMMSTWKGQRD
ncbi:hypothetical protein D8B22_01685 [Verminephrobacter aporrectodeae subsp. tuberculatae]|uniref:hypothetical protein n=1 Tax=Verminephrobacter aporrectodeae TaxID=1110389 RepID=UPI002244115F|nr:hypothetical protein [Verminephrobacter aporrectodeae]MCW8164931.1 hypothetical protein [Verminephrobacter aporrectodeae subsp. tuberculatae]MCW8167879.1 hypothetical protein [Verminephrobacter aporrectodeae subsp. tuberculatae]